MITELLDFIRAWPVLAQFFFIITLATLITSIVLVIVGGISDFLTHGLPAIIHGHPQQNTEETAAEDR